MNLNFDVSYVRNPCAMIACNLLSCGNIQKQEASSEKKSKFLHQKKRNANKDQYNEKQNQISKSKH